MVAWLPSALAAGERGAPVLNIVQPFKSSGMMLTCLKDSAVASLGDFKGKPLGVWFGGNEDPFLNWMSRLNLKIDGSDVTVLKQGFNVDALLQKQAACITTMTYIEHWQVIDAGVKFEDLVTFKYEDAGVATLEDGPYVIEETLKDPAFVERMAIFISASMKGWQYAEEHTDEAAEIVLEKDETGAQTGEHQKRMAQIAPRR